MKKKNIFKYLAELFLYLVPVISMVLVKITEKYCIIWYYVICVVALVAQILLFVIAKKQEASNIKHKKDIDDIFHVKYNEKNEVVSTEIEGGTFAS